MAQRAFAALCASDYLILFFVTSTPVALIAAPIRRSIHSSRFVVSPVFGAGGLLCGGAGFFGSVEVSVSSGTNSHLPYTVISDVIVTGSTGSPLHSGLSY